MKKIILLISLLILPACSSLGLDEFKFDSAANVSKTKTLVNYEKVEQIINSSVEKKIF